MIRLSPQRLLLFGIAACSVILFIRAVVNAPQGNYDRARGLANRKSSDDVPSAKLAAAEDKCVYDSACENPSLSILLAAETVKRPPYACLNDIRTFSVRDLVKGVNVVVLNPETAMVENIQAFDVLRTDEKLIEWLRSFDKHQVVLVVSYGNVAEGVSMDARKLFGLFGAQKILDWRHGNAYAMLGQWGLNKGAAQEMLVPLGEEATDSSRLTNCYSFPLGTLRNVTSELRINNLNRVDEEKLAEFVHPLDKKSDVTLGETWANCGRELPCDPNQIPMFFYSGTNKDDSPKMCVADKIVFDRDLNDAGRGLNIAVVDPKSKTILRVGHFDTYEKASTGLEKFLDQVDHGLIVVVVSFDEASSMLSDMAKQIFYELGSSMIRRIKFRAAWYFVGQKGINAYTPFENLNYAVGNNWAKPIKEWVCAPQSLSDKRAHTSGAGARLQNIPKRHFCAKYDGHDSFCSESAIDKPLIPRPLTDLSRSDDPIFNVPILVVGGASLPRLRETLSSLLSQPGINTQMVIVAHNLDLTEAADLATLFHFKSLPMYATTSDYNEILRVSLTISLSLFPNADSVIVIEEDVLLAPDFLYYMSQLYSVVKSDPSVTFIQSFNYNGFARTSLGDESLVLREENMPPAYAFLGRRKHLEQYLDVQLNGEDCCQKLHNWRMSPSVSLVPDVSRIELFMPAPKDLGLDDHHELFAEMRLVSGKSPSGGSVLNASTVSTDENYLDEIGRIINGSEKVDWTACHEGGFKKSRDRDHEKESDFSSIAITYDSDETLNELVSCFGILKLKEFLPGTYAEYTRFFADKLQVILVNNSTGSIVDALG